MWKRKRDGEKDWARCNPGESGEREAQGSCFFLLSLFLFVFFSRLHKWLRQRIALVKLIIIVIINMIPKAFFLSYSYSHSFCKCAANPFFSLPCLLSLWLWFPGENTTLQCIVPVLFSRGIEMHVLPRHVSVAVAHGEIIGFFSEPDTSIITHIYTELLQSAAISQKKKRQREGFPYFMCSVHIWKLVW